jgi:3',5'-cyclic AMP phosphodiesterase CpdA
VIRIAHVSDLHYDGSRQLRVTIERLVELVADADPDLVVVTGDLSADGKPEELDEVRSMLQQLDPIARLVIPGNRDLEPSSGPPGEARPLPPDSDLDFFLTLEPALALGLEDEADADSDSDDRWVSRFGTTEPAFNGRGIAAVGVPSSPKLSSQSLSRAARRLRKAPDAFRVFALHHGLLPVPGRKLREGDLIPRAGDVLSLLCELGVDLVLHGHVHRAHVWRIADFRGDLVVASAGALVNDGRRDASFLEVAVDGSLLEIGRRSVATGLVTPLFSSDRSSTPTARAVGAGR